MNPRSSAFAILVCGALGAQQSQPASPAAGQRIVFKKLEYSVVPPAGWKVDSKSAEKEDEGYLLICSRQGAGGRIALRVLPWHRGQDLDASYLAHAQARSKKPAAKVVEAKNLRLGGDEAALYVCEDSPKDDAGGKGPTWEMVCVVKGEEQAVEYRVTGTKDDVTQQRPALEACFASTRLGAWAMPGTKLKHPWHPLTLLPPEGWRPLEGATGSAWTLGPIDDDKLKPTLRITFSDPQKDVGLSRLKSTLEALQKKTAKDFKIVSAKELPIAGRKGAVVTGKLKVDDKPMAHVCWFVLAEKRTYLLGLTCREDQLQTVQPAVETCLASLELGKE